MSSKVTIGVCIYCLKTRSVKLNPRTLVGGRREGTCLDCANLTETARQKMLDEPRAKAASNAEKFRRRKR